MDESSFSETIIIGAGMAGLACAHALRSAGRPAKLFDKGRGPGGRMATRRVDRESGQLHFDHGAQFFTARDPAFQQCVLDWEQAGAVAKWPAIGADAWVGTPGMNGPLKAMAAPLDVTWSARIDAVRKCDEHWQVEIEGEPHSCTHLLIAIPPEQVGELLEDAAPELAETARQVQSRPCWTVMAHFEQPIGISSDFVRSDTGAIVWAARNGAKPHRTGGESWVLQASAARSQETLELEKDEAARLLLAEFFEQSGLEGQAPAYLTAHRWRYALPKVKESPVALWNADQRIGLAGDWLHSPRVEGAWLSGTRLAGLMIGS